MYYRYGMDRFKIADVKKRIESGQSKEKICRELNLSFGQVGFVGDTICGGKKNNPVGHLKTFAEISEGDRVECLDEAFGVGTVMQLYADGDLMSVKFDKRNLATMCSIKKKSTVHDNKKRKLVMLTVSAL